MSILKGNEKHWLTALALSFGLDLYKRSISCSRHDWQDSSVLNAMLGACIEKELFIFTGLVSVIATI